MSLTHKELFDQIKTLYENHVTLVNSKNNLSGYILLILIDKLDLTRFHVLQLNNYCGTIYGNILPGNKIEVFANNYKDLVKELCIKCLNICLEKIGFVEYQKIIKQIEEL